MTALSTGPARNDAASADASRTGQARAGQAPAGQAGAGQAGAAPARAAAVTADPALAGSAPGGRAGVVEDRVKLGILGVIMVAALAASFTHMHDWTMRWMPEGTPGWFGWANAAISELVPLVATLSLRKRLHDGKSIWSYPLVILIAGALLSLAAQLSAVGADASWSAKFLAALPALAFLFLSKLVIGDLDATRRQAAARARQQQTAAADAARRQETLAAARAETAEAHRALAETRAALQTKTDRVQAETAAREQAETRAVEAEQRAETEAETRAETEARARAEIAAHERAAGEAHEAARAARQHATEQVELARLVQGRLAEAREAADRAAAARVAAEQRAAAHERQVTDAAEQAEHGLRQQLAAAVNAAAAAERRVAELVEQARTLRAGREEARQAAERQSTARVLAEQRIEDLERGRDAAFEELERVRRQLARATEKAETVKAEIAGTAVARRPEISRTPARKSADGGRATGRVIARVALPESLPDVESVRPETVATVLVARLTYPDATQTELAEKTAISDRTIRKVLRTVPAEIAHQVAGQVLALTDGRTTS